MHTLGVTLPFFIRMLAFIKACDEIQYVPQYTSRASHSVTFNSLRSLHTALQSHTAYM